MSKSRCAQCGASACDLWLIKETGRICWDCVQGGDYAAKEA